MRRFLLPLLLALTATATAATVTLTPGQTGQLGGQPITVLRVQDNRCPINALCIRPGELIVKVLIGQGRSLRFLTLELPAAPGAAWKGVRILSAPGRSTFDRSAVPITFTDGR